MRGIIYLEDGTIYEGKGFGKAGTSVGEIVFNTSMTGYQEILTDPSYSGQIVNMTYPLIGNYGVNEIENESSKVHAKGLIVKEICKEYSNYMANIDIDSMLRNMGVVGVYDVDTRSITKKIRSCGSLKCLISNEDLSLDEIKKKLSEVELKHDFMKRVGTKEVISIKGKGPKIGVIDFGIKQNIIRNLISRDCDITIFPYNTSYDDIVKINPDGILLSNGPGDPKEATEAVETIKKIIKSIPTLGICMGHQVLALAVGGKTYKLKYGHRGGNHGVYDIERDRAYITSQNHGYVVDKESIEKDMIVTHINLNDETVEGMKHKTLPVFSVQFHPEGSPGPTDTSYIFDKFISMVKGE
ncbi:glutamine-hydrolyzing carbamoyl-phosphate synthase small subunit [Alkalithermobacter paradoxus]|uniref:Carbamoyl phosphate synthase small chain n=1 Tax=Alkalithermobacter paradoxus TaxID=29349 RepID=A0A1V4I7U0_9FIRM|nr:carbamoyl-phosphate synthase small chain [[Clostridium] thermoalcaliphilum]